MGIFINQFMELAVVFIAAVLGFALLAITFVVVLALAILILACAYWLFKFSGSRK